MTKTLSENRTVECVHFALHGALGLADGKQTVAMKTTKDDSSMSTPSEIGNVIKVSGATVKAIILNLCRGGENESAVDLIGGTEYLIG